MSGRLSVMMWRTPMITQSVGVPRTAKCRGEISRKPQRIVQRQRMRDARLVALGRDHPDVVGDLLGDILDDADTRRVDAVVVGAQNPHEASSCLSR